MRVIVPMAGRGSRLRPHTLVTPKPLVPIAGKTIVRRLLEDIHSLLDQPIEEIAFIIGDFGTEAEIELHKIGESLGAKVSIYFQKEPLGTAHAIWQAADRIEGNTIVAFADTLFRFPKGFRLDTEKDGQIWVKKVDDPRNYGVVTLDDAGVINQFVEKPEKFVSDLGILGIYYVKDGNLMKEKINHILENDIKDKGEYQFTTVLDLMKEEGEKFYPAEVIEWMDCGNKKVLLETTRKILHFEQQEGNGLISEDADIANSVIIPPCYIGPGVSIKHSVVGPFVSIEAETELDQVVIKNSTIRSHAKVSNSVLEKAMIGMYASCERVPSSWDMGDYSRIS